MFDASIKSFAGNVKTLVPGEVSDELVDFEEAEDFRGGG